MCIALLTTAHPDYALILINNRDEFLTRPTAPLSWHPDNPNILSGRDLLRSAHGTWLGITKFGNIAVLTNFREDIPPDPEARSRGEILKTFLTQPDHWPTSGFLELLDDLSDVGGFTMVFGNPARHTYPALQMFGVLSNRSEEWKEGKVINVLFKGSKETIGVSNGGFGEAGWKKVDLGREMMMGVVEKDVLRRAEDGGVDGGGEKVLIEELFEVLSKDTLPKRDVDVGWDGYVKEFRNSIFIPAVGGEGDGKGLGDGMSGIYGTQKQSIVLVDHKGHVTFVERTLYDDNAEPLKGGARDRRFEFDIEKWGELLLG